MPSKEAVIIALIFFVLFIVSLIVLVVVTIHQVERKSGYEPRVKKTNQVVR